MAIPNYDNYTTSDEGDIEAKLDATAKVVHRLVKDAAERERIQVQLYNERNHNSS